MSGYTPLYVRANKTGLVQNRVESILPDDAYPTLVNAFIFRETIRRKQGYQLLDRLRRVLVGSPLGVTSGGATFTGNVFSILSLEATAEIQVGSVVTGTGAPFLVDDGLGNLKIGATVHGSINYVTGAITVTGGVAAASPIAITFNYYPGLPVMGLRTRELNGSSNDLTVAFDTKYAYNHISTGWVEFLPGTTWTGTDYNFFWTTNYWSSPAPTNAKIFWVTNDSGTSGDPIRYTDGIGSGTGTWVNFAPTVNAGGTLLTQCLALLPFRGRMLAFNTLEGANLATSLSYSNRIRWSAIGNPISDVSTIFPIGTVNVDAWRDDIRGQGGYLNIPTNEDIVSVGFVRDNLVIYCESSTWQLRYTGRSIAPFQIEKVNTELGSGSTFSAIQFDTSLVGIGDKGVVECDSFKSQLIDIKIPDLVMQDINNKNNGQKRVHGIRDYFQRIAYWTYPESASNGTYPDRRLVYNYENDSWAIFTDSLTCLGTFQPSSSRTWANPSGTNTSTKVKWEEANFPWGNRPALILSIIGGNQQGYVEYLDEQTTNDPSLTIKGITGNTTTPTVITSPNHNLQTGAVIKITAIPTGTPFASTLNGNIFGIIVQTDSTFSLMVYNSTTGEFSDPQVNAPATYVGGGQISVRDNFIIKSKKFNFMEQGQNIQIGYLDVHMKTSEEGAITLNMYVDYDDNLPSNEQADGFFNTVIPTSAPSNGTQDNSKTLQKVFCPTRGNYITIEYTLSNAQMNGVEQENDVNIDEQIIWQRPAGRTGNF